jgi:hypothetical protein
MNISKKELIRIIKQEIERELSEREEPVTEANPFHKKDGTWGSEKNAETYSFTKAAPVSDDLKMRGKFTGRKSDGTPKVSAKFGQNSGKDQCGRKDFSGDDRDAVYDCSDYKKKYRVNEDSLIDEEAGAPGADAAYLTALIKRELGAAVQQLSKQNTEKACRPSLRDFIRFQALLSKAQSKESK